MRTVLIDNFRGEAHFEVVVAPAARLGSSEIQKVFLRRSIQRLGAENTLLIANKSDVSIKPWVPIFIILTLR